ncbi:uncharacterized protein METZ01_LOCUS452259, partial [marine metagenome]
CSFNIPDGVHLYGGFFGNETQLIERDKSDRNEDGIQKEWEFTYPSILSGDIGRDDENSDGNYINETWEDIAEGDEEFPTYGTNAYSVVTFANVTSETVLDGLTITASGSNHRSYVPDKNAYGQPSVPSGRGNGGGISDEIGGDSNPTIRNCIIQGNVGDYGGGIYLADGIIEYCLIKGNKARNKGGGASVGSSNLSDRQIGSFKFCSFIGNQAGYGGGVYLRRGGTLKHCIFMDNKSTGDGGGIYASGTSVSLKY